MAITPQQREHLVALTTVMFNAPPGAEFLAEFEGYLEEGISLGQIAVNLAATSAFNAQFDGLVTDTAKINKVLEGLGIDTDSPAYEEAFAFFNDSLAAGRNAGELLVEAGEFLYTTEDETFAQAASTFKNKVDAGVYHSVVLQIASGSVAELQSAVADVTADPASVEAAKARADVIAEGGDPTEGEEDEDEDEDEESSGGGGGGGGGGVAPTYTLEQALGLSTLPARYNIDEDASVSVDFDGLEAAEKGSTAAYDILVGALNLPADGSVKDGVDLLNAKFLELFKYSVTLERVDVGNVSFNEGLTLFFASQILVGEEVKMLKDLRYTVKDSIGELLDITVGLEPKEEELYINANGIVVEGAVTVAEVQELNGILRDIGIATDSVTVTYSIADEIQNVFGFADENPTDQEKVPDNVGRADVELTGGTLDVSGYKQESGIPTTLDLSKMTVGGDVTVKVAKLEDNNKGDFTSTGMGSRKSDQTVKLPELDAIEGKLIIENMTIASAPTFDGTSANNSTLSEAAIIKFDGSISPGEGDAVTFSVTAVGWPSQLQVITGVYDGSGWSFKGADGEVIEPEDADDPTVWSLELTNGTSTRHVAWKMGENGQIMGVATDSYGVAEGSGVERTYLDAGTYRAAERSVTNDVLDFSVNAEITPANHFVDAIESISIVKDSDGWADITITLNESNGEGSLVLDNVVRYSTLEQIIANEWKGDALEGINSFTASDDNGDLAELIGILGAGGTFYFDDGQVVQP